MNSNYNNRYQQNNRYDQNKPTFDKFSVPADGVPPSEPIAPVGNFNGVYSNPDSGIGAPSPATISMVSNPGIMNGSIDTQSNGFYNNNNRRYNNQQGYNGNGRMSYNNNYSGNGSNYFEDWSKPLPVDESLEK